MFVREQFITYTTAELFVAQVHGLMTSHVTCCMEAFWTFTAKVQLRTFMMMSIQMSLKTDIVAKFLPTNVTCQPSTFTM